MCRTFVETPIFTQKIEELGGEQILRSIEDEILEDHDCGATIAGTGGLRKLRAADHFVYVYGKDEAENLSADEKKAMKKLVEILKGAGHEKK